MTLNKKQQDSLDKLLNEHPLVKKEVPVLNKAFDGAFKKLAPKI